MGTGQKWGGTNKTWEICKNGVTTCCNPRNLRKCITNFCYIRQLVAGAYIGLTVGLLAVPTQQVDDTFRGGCLIWAPDMLYAGLFAVGAAGLSFL